MITGQYWGMAVGGVVGFGFVTASQGVGIIKIWGFIGVGEFIGGKIGWLYANQTIESHMKEYIEKWNLYPKGENDTVTGNGGGSYGPHLPDDHKTVINSWSEAIYHEVGSSCSPNGKPSISTGPCQYIEGQ